ncbi:MAG: hypothetical protein RDV48_20795 [Candidatus Eremiobacteraeota bacterium]|nr:hypothetical protein [Candidatus Eremiobacteraeota bacterium]
MKKGVLLLCALVLVASQACCTAPAPDAGLTPVPPSSSDAVPSVPAPTRKSSLSGSPLKSPPPFVTTVKGGDTLIVPGKRVGAIALGEQIDRVESRIGKAEIVPREDFQIYSFVQYLLDLGVQKDSVMIILVMNPAYATSEGIAVGRGITTVIRAYGRNYEYEEIKNADVEYLISYPAQGISFSVWKEKVVKIKIYNQKLTIRHMKQ